MQYVLSLLAVIAIAVTSYSVCMPTVQTGTFPGGTGLYGTSFINAGNKPAGATKLVFKTTGGSSQPVWGVESGADVATTIDAKLKLWGTFGIMDGVNYIPVYEQRFITYSHTVNATVFDGLFDYSGTSGATWDEDSTIGSTKEYEVDVSSYPTGQSILLYCTRDALETITQTPVTWWGSFKDNYDVINMQWEWQ